MVIKPASDPAPRRDRRETIVATSTVEAEVREVIDDWVNALRDKDAAGVVSHQTEDFVQFALAPPLRAEALDREGLEDWFSSWEGRIEYEIRDQKIVTAGEVAFSHSLNRMRATTTEGGQTDLWFRQTLCFRRVGREWRIAHEHDSVPFYMDDARAAIDLAP
jgi:PhnB protein